MVLYLQMFKLAYLLFFAQSLMTAAGLAGNWVVRDPLPDGTVRRTYFELKQDGSHITGHVRSSQSYYEITDSTATPDGFTLTGSWNGANTRTAKYEIHLVGDNCSRSWSRPLASY